MTARQPFGDSRSARIGKFAAALLTSTPIGPSADSTSSNAAAIRSGSRTSHATPTARPPALTTAWTPSSRCPASRLAIPTDAPQRPNSAAIARPKPVPPPVIRTVTPAKVAGGSIAVPGDGRLGQTALFGRAGQTNSAGPVVGTRAR